MSEALVSAAQRAAIERLQPIMGDQAYLGGGVALALRLSHRSSRDLDFFVPGGQPEVEVAREVAKLERAKITSRAAGTLYLELDGVPVSVIRYDYPMLGPLEGQLGVQVASLDDLACMKLHAIARRGAARDFWDIYEVMIQGPRALDQLLESFRSKYAAEDIGYLVRALVYFEDAEAEPHPRGLSEAYWESIKARLRKDVRRL